MYSNNKTRAITTTIMTAISSCKTVKAGNSWFAGVMVGNEVGVDDGVIVGEKLRTVKFIENSLKVFGKMASL